LAMTGGQASLLFDEQLESIVSCNIAEELRSSSPILPVLSEEKQLHNEFVQFIIKKAGVNLFE